MLRILTSLSFLYALVIVLLLVYGWIYHRDFYRSRLHHRRFPLVFGLIGFACLSFLWINLHAPLQLRTYSNLDHHFIRLDGFDLRGGIELGKTDTVNVPGNTYNRFLFTRAGGPVTIQSSYSEEPFYIQGEQGYRIASTNYPASGHTVGFVNGSSRVSIALNANGDIELRVNEKLFTRNMTIRKGISCWNVFRDDDTFINDPHYNERGIVEGLKGILLLRDDVSRKEGGEFKFFLSGKMFQEVTGINYDGKPVQPASIQFSQTLADKSRIAWGLGFLDNNRNQYRISYGGQDSFSILYQYPVSFPLTEEDKVDWTEHGVTKFLVADGKDMTGVPDVFREGFLFPSVSDDKAVSFSPVLLTYRKSAGEQPLQMKASWLQHPSQTIDLSKSYFTLPARQPGINWRFSIRNTNNWDFGDRTLSAGTWQWLLFGSLGFFFLLVLVTSLLKPVERQSWVWQLLSSITMVLLTTRFLLYWRYKNFPPYEGLDLPSQQQLQSFSNFGIIVFAALVLALVFGFSTLRSLASWIIGQINRARQRPYRSSSSSNITTGQMMEGMKRRMPMLRRLDRKAGFFGSWFALLLLSGGFAALNHFDPGVCRHIAIAFILIYFIYLYISYRYSPLVATASRSWWRLGTGNTLDVIVSNPVKILLSVSLLGLFVFIDIGFAIVFLNFLLFNEAFLCINYGIAGLSAGSRRNAALFGSLGLFYLVFFVLNLLYAPYIFKYLLELPPYLYVVGYLAFSVSLSYVILRLFAHLPVARRRLLALATAAGCFLLAFFFFPKERILEKAAMTKYRIDVLTTPVEDAIATAYTEGKTYEPVIRAAQNQWFINTFIDERNNPSVQSVGFTLLPHAPQNKGAKYNAQATDLVASRFLIGEHGKWAVLLYVFLLIIPTTLLASFYKLYPDFTNRINENYPRITAGFSLLNYLLITALLVILAATGRYIFFGQDLPFGSILSKQSILFPCLLILAAVFAFRRIPLEHYANRRKLAPSFVVFGLLLVLLFFVRPAFNRNKEFGVAELAKQMDGYIQAELKPLMDHFDTSAKTRRLPVARKDQLFTDSIRHLIAAGLLTTKNKFFASEVNAYARSGFSRHLDQRRLLYLDISNGSPELAVNANYFRVEPPPHLQQLWTGNVLGDTSTYHVSLWNSKDGRFTSYRFAGADVGASKVEKGLVFGIAGDGRDASLYMINNTGSELQVKIGKVMRSLNQGDSLRASNPFRATIMDKEGNEQLVSVQPDAFMKNYFVNGSRFYVYPMAERFIWARNFSEAIASDYTISGQVDRNAFVSLDFGLMDSLSVKLQSLMKSDTSFRTGAEYGICIADGNGRILAMNDFIKGLTRPDPNDKSAFNRVLMGDEGIISQSLLRKQIGNINLLRLNPGPGSTLKPIVFSAVASQLNLDWDAFASEGFSEKQHQYGGAKVAEYDFEKNNGRITSVVDYIKFSDNYYHSNVLLLGSYRKQELQSLLADHFSSSSSGPGLHWPYFDYQGKRLWLNSFDKWPGFQDGRADFGQDSSFVSIGLLSNFGFYTRPPVRNFDMLQTAYDSILFLDAGRRSGFILPENALFDQQGENLDHRIPYDLFTACFRGHVKGSSQVRIPPARMVEAMGRMISQNRHYNLTLDPWAEAPAFEPFYVDKSINYNSFLSTMRESVFTGMREVLFRGTAARLGGLLKNGDPYFYYAKTGTTGDDEVKSKSKLLTLIISEKDITDPDFNFRDNRFYTIYFTSQNGPALQKEAFQAEVVRFLQSSQAFKEYMKDKK